MNELSVWAAVVVIVLVTAALRFLPFAVFSGTKKVPAIIQKLGKMLPFAIMGMLVVYCLRNVSFATAEQWLPALIACAVVAVLHIWKRNTLISILSGTVFYMLLVQLVF